MLHVPRQGRCAALAVVCFHAASAVPAPPADESAGGETAYRVEIDSRMTVSGAAFPKMEVEAATGLDYTCFRSRSVKGRASGVQGQRTPDPQSSTPDAFTIDVRIDRLRVRAVQNGTVREDFEMTRDGMLRRKGKEMLKVAAETAPERLRMMLNDAFGHPVVRLTVDANGRELERLVSTRPGAKSLIQSGAVENVRLFHAPFHADRRRWTAPVTVSMGSGGFARGELSYEIAPRRPDDPPNLLRVSVAGKAVGENTTPAFQSKNAEYDISGVQMYDTSRREWDSGRLTMKLSYDVYRDDEKLGEATGTMVVRLTQRIVRRPSRAADR